MLGFSCPACKHYGEADNALAGEIIGCANCLAHFRLPETGGPAPVTGSADAARPSIQEPGKGAVVRAWARCPLCGARKTDSARCQFCGHWFTTAETVLADRARRRRARTAGALLKILAFGAVLLGLPALGYYYKSAADTEQRLCKEALMIMHNAILQSQANPKGVPTSVGRRFLVEVAVRERIALLCPAVTVKGPRLPVDFRGPVRPWEDLLPDDPVAADREGNHGGLTVLLKSGAVEYASKGSYLYRRAIEGTKE